jgi:hypothetical protein
VSSAALPALPFLLEALDDASDELAVEILDILRGFATCSRPEVAGADWIRTLRAQLLLEQPRFERLAGHETEDVASWATNVLEELGSHPTS